MRVVLATRNQHKVVELAEALAALDFQVEGLDQHPQVGEIEETGDTFEANAILKATEVARETGLPALADDSGLEVDVLGGAPGVRSARYAGENATDADNRRALVDALRGVLADRQGSEAASSGAAADATFAAGFVCVLALALPTGESKTVVGRCRGHVRLEERGSSGFGYDSLFVAEGDTQTFAEIEPREKQSKSHRARALSKAAELARWASDRSSAGA